MTNGRVAVRNLTRASQLAGAAEVARGPLRRGLGLMGRSGWTDSDGLILQRCNSVHSCFMRMPIDVVYVDAAGQVLRCAPAMRPWRVGPIVRRAKWVLELPVGALASSRTEPGDRLEIRSG